MILLIDNYDSFAMNLARYLRRLGADVVCVRNDALSVGEIAEREPQLIVISPGPCTPDQAGCSLDVARELSGRFPLLGVCLGHQVIAQSFGGTIVRAEEPTHGMASEIEHDGRHEFVGLPNPFAAGRYHSLVVQPSTMPTCLEISAQSRDGTMMAFRHVSLPVFGWQFHPESILTESGFELLANLLRCLGFEVADVNLPTIASERDVSNVPDDPHPKRPITF